MTNLKQLATILGALTGTARKPGNKAAALKAIHQGAAELGLTGDTVLAAAADLLDGRLDAIAWRAQLTNPAQPEEDAASGSAPAAPRAGSKQALIVGLLGGELGATLDELVTATGWLPHTTRAALTVLRRKGYQLGKDRRQDGKAAYRILGTAA